MIYIGYQTTIHRHEPLLCPWRCPTSIRETANTNIAIQRKKKVRNTTQSWSVVDGTLGIISSMINVACKSSSIIVYNSISQVLVASFDSPASTTTTIVKQTLIDLLIFWHWKPSLFFPLILLFLPLAL